MDITHFAPILIPTLNRYEHFRRCVESFGRCMYADKTELVIGLDYPPSDKYRVGYEKIKQYLPTITGFKKVTVLTTDHNLGVTGNFNRMFQYIRENGEECYVISEDDNEVAPCFLEYVNWGLQYAKDDESVYAICGFKRVDTSDIKNNVYKYQRFNAWAYGQWFKRCEKLDKFMSLGELKRILDEMSLLDVFNKNVYKGASIISMLKEGVVYGDKLPDFLPAEEQFCLFPTEPMSKNHGQDGSGIHGGTNKTANLYDSMQLCSSQRFIPHIVEDLYQPQLEKIYASTYKTSLVSKIRCVCDFILYKLFGLGIYHKYGQPKYKFSIKKVR